ncbi:hypothetical protein [Lacipirellula sp.]|uniref:hypothetical protein n=1 Tax=Lacipirellula sp. TaxID=2691419 RepID=UPI003D11151F
MNTFTKQLGRNRYACLLSEHEFRTQLEAEEHQESLIRKLQAQGLLSGDYSFGELDKAYRSRNAA